MSGFSDFLPLASWEKAPDKSRVQKTPVTPLKAPRGTPMKPRETSMKAREMKAPEVTVRTPLIERTAVRTAAQL